MRFVDPTNDVAFKKIFGNEQQKEVLISFINAVLNLTDEKEVVDIQILNPYQAPRIEALKNTILDVRARDKRGISFIVEMQVDNVAGYKKRFLYYAAKAYSDQIERGEDYPKLNQVIFIGILDFKGFEGDAFLSRHIILNNDTFKHEIKDLELNFIELPKFTKSQDEIDTILDKWIYFIKHAPTLDIIPDNLNSSALKTAYEIADSFSWSRQELEVYDYWGIRAQDERGAITAAHEKGRKEGLQEGRVEMARTMLQEGLDVTTIARVTGLSSVEITEISIDDAT